jgi:hypothetical protein
MAPYSLDEALTVILWMAPYSVPFQVSIAKPTTNPMFETAHFDETLQRESLGTLWSYGLGTCHKNTSDA